MPYEILEDAVTSDVTFRIRAHDLCELFRDAADATTSVMVASLDDIAPQRTIEVSVSAEALDLLLLRFLEEIVFHKDAAGLLLRARRVRVESEDGLHRARADLVGEPLAPERHRLAADVKAVTLHGLYVRATDEGWEAEVTLDV